MMRVQVKIFLMILVIFLGTAFMSSPVILQTFISQQFIAQAAGRTLYVATTGIDSGGCTSSSSPCRTVKYALTQMADGDTLKVAPGTYSSSSDSTADYTCPVSGKRNYDIVIPQKDCSIMGCTIEVQGTVGSALFTNGSAGICIDSSDGWTIRGLRFEGINIPGTIYSSVGTVIEDSKFLYFDISSGKVFFVYNSGNVRVTRSAFDNQVGCAAYHDSAGLFIIENSQDVIFEQSRFAYDNSIGGIANSTNVTLRRNTFTHFTEHGVTLTDDPKNILIENNVFSGDPVCANVFNTCAGGANQGLSCTQSNQATTCPNSYCVIPVGPRVIDVYEVDGLTVRNNTVVGHGYMWKHWFYLTYSLENQATAGCTNGVCDRKNIRVYNNLIYDIMSAAVNWVNVSYSAFTTQSGLSLDGNLYFKGGESWSCYPSGGTFTTFDPGYKGSSCWAGTNNMDPNGLNVEPTFANYAGQDYRPASASSPQVNKGVSGPDSLALGGQKCASEDFLGNPRGADQCDIGAYEFASAGGDTTPPNPPTGLVVQ